MKSILALIAGGVSVLAFSPFEWWYLLFPSYAALFFVWQNASGWQAFRLGLFFGIGQFGIGVSWVYISIQSFGGMPPALAAACVVGFVFLLSLFPAVAGLLQAVFRRWSFLTRAGVVMPVFLILLEWLRGWVLTGLPWLSTGYALLPTSASGYAPVGGVYLVGMLGLVSVGVVMATIRKTNAASVFSAILLAGAWIGGVAFNQHSWSRVDGDAIKVGLIQNNVPLLDKWSVDRKTQILTEYFEASALHRDKDLVVWPEGAIPDYIEELTPDFWEALAQHPADFAIGALSRPRAESENYYNVVVSVSDRTMVYNKQHLVPFGEFFPMKKLLAPVLEHLTIPMSNFSRWLHPQSPLEVAGHKAAVSICYEDAFPHEARSIIPRSGFLLNVSEDMWFGDSLAPHQRLQMAQFRSRESERPMVRSSNNGLSSLINWQGKIIRIAPQFEKASVEGQIQPRTGTTPFVRFGDYPVFIMGCILLLCGLIFGRRDAVR